MMDADEGLKEEKNKWTEFYPVQTELTWPLYQICWFWSVSNWFGRFEAEFQRRITSNIRARYLSLNDQHSRILEDSCDSFKVSIMDELWISGGGIIWIGIAFEMNLPINSYYESFSFSDSDDEFGGMQELDEKWWCVSFTLLLNWILSILGSWNVSSRSIGIILPFFIFWNPFSLPRSYNQTSIHRLLNRFIHIQFVIGVEKVGHFSSSGLNQIYA